MKLISLHINGFGALCNEDYKFTPGLNSFFMPNGVGKTTLTDFILAMLYGMKETRSNSPELGMRRHYLPFANPANYGGSMEIEADGKRINIVRTFHASRRGEDTLVVYDDKGDKLDVPQDGSLGEMFFGIDEDSFKRTVLFSSISSKTKAGGTDSINRKLDKAVSDIDTNKLSDVLESLAAQAKEIISPARARVNLGKVNVLQEEVDNLSREIRDLAQLEASLDDKYSKLNSAEAQAKSVNNNIADLERMSREMVLWRQIDSMTDKLFDYESEVKGIMSKYPKGMPSDNDIDSLVETEKSINNTLAALEAAKDSAVESKELSAMRSKYPKGLPDETLVARLMQARLKLDDMNIEIAKLKNIGEDPNLESDLNACLDKVKMLNETRHQLEYAYQPDDKNIVPKYMIVILAVALVAAVALSFFGYGLIGFIVGVIGVGAYEFIKFKNKKSALKSAQESRSKLENTINVIKSDLRAFFAAHGIEGENYEENINLIKEKLKKYKQLKFGAEKIKSSIERVLAAYRINPADIDNINSDRRALEMLKSKADEGQQRYEKFNYSLKLLEQRAESILNRYGIAPQSDIRAVLDGINNDKSRLQYISDSKRDVYDQIERIKSENALTLRPDPSVLRSIDTLREQSKNLLIEVKRLESELSDDEARLAALPELREEVAKKEEQIKSLTEEYNVIMLTRDFIAKADLSLKEKYIAPIKNGYLKYMDKIGASMGAQIVMDTDFRIKILVDGVPHDSRHLSDGESTCLELCLRAALVDSMYRAEKPFLIFDDPFTELDADNFFKISRMMQSLAETEVDEGYQILYFTCHQARQL